MNKKTGPRSHEGLKSRSGHVARNEVRCQYVENVREQGVGLTTGAPLFNASR